MAQDAIIEMRMRACPNKYNLLITHAAAWLSHIAQPHTARVSGSVGCLARRHDGILAARIMRLNWPARQKTWLSRV